MGLAHLALGVIHTQGSATRALLFPDPGNFEMLCRALGGSREPAPLIPEDISYLDAARDALDGATVEAARLSPGGETHPIHILLGLFHPWDQAGHHPVEPDTVTLTLAATGLGDTRLHELLPALTAGS